MKFAFIAQEVAFLVETMCRVLGVARSGFYAWKKRPKPARAKSDALLFVHTGGTPANFTWADLWLDSTTP